MTDPMYGQSGTGHQDPEVSRLWVQLNTEGALETSTSNRQEVPSPVAAPVVAAPAPIKTGGIKLINSSFKPAAVPAASAARPASANVVKVLNVKPPAKKSNPRKDAAESLAALVRAHGITSIPGRHVMSLLQDSLADNQETVMRESGMLLAKALVEIVRSAVEPSIVLILPQIFDRLADKVASVRLAAEGALLALASNLCPSAFPVILPVLNEAMGPTRKWQNKEGVFKMLTGLTESTPLAVRASLPDLVPLVSDGMVDAREEVKTAAIAAARALFSLVGNRDIEPCIPDFLACISRPNEMPNAVIKLSGTTFVQQVEAPALAVMVPLLLRGLKGETPIKRKTAVIISNMSKLVNNPADVTAFLPKLCPRLEQAANEVADPECRSVCAAAHATVVRIMEDGAALDLERSNVVYDFKSARTALNSILLHAPNPPYMEDTLLKNAIWYVSQIAVGLVAKKNWEEAVWCDNCVVPFLSSFMDSEDEVFDVAKNFMSRCIQETREEISEDEEEEEGGEDICQCYFSLAYGGKILLNNTHLRLKRGHRYGLCGHNGVGKSTLMRAINDGKVEGFPPKDQVCTAYVEHDIDSSLSDLSSVDFMVADKTLQGARPTTRDQIVEALTSFGFSTELRDRPVASLSGGWKMKLALARAMCMHPDILLLDEPTNHLDTTNVAWLEDYLCQLKDVTCLVVSHDSGFLDKVCTDIIHYENRKLKRYKGNLSAFVEIKPEARSYYELESAKLRFNFPKPGFLDGITSSEKPVMKLTKLGFTYPDCTTPQLVNVSVNCRLASRVAVQGVNGAGKSTLIKILTGELKPQTGVVYKHPNVRVAYVAQHAFHHIEEHLDATPNQYLRRRYVTGEDKEETSKVTRVLTAEEEEAIRRQVFVIDGHNRYLDKIVGRRKKKRSWEYEIKWLGLDSIKFNRWFTREELESRGFIKMINEYDGKLAASAAGADVRPLTQASIEQYLSDFGLEPEFGTHSAIRGLSGGQKVKLVLAAAMWNCPHMLIMDEPTNYLDRDSLGALAAAIREYAGGVILISHHNEFVSAITNEVWHVEAGRVTVTKVKESIAAAGEEEDGEENGAEKK